MKPTRQDHAQALARRREALVAEGDLRRAELVRACRRLEPTLRWVDTTFAVLRAVRPRWTLALPLLAAAPLVARRLGGFVAALAVAVRAWRILRG